MADRSEQLVEGVSAPQVGVDTPSSGQRGLSLLKAAGIFVDDKRGAQVYYRLRVPCLASFFNCIERVLRATAEEKTAVLAR
ncbi:MAG: hypothetical protein KBD01_12725 [Acidobacteria bacterium]|nr:hypothetical protein [Acidobacteriota bacterium]